jgi:hypothetical protein
LIKTLNQKASTTNKPTLNDLLICFAAPDDPQAMVDPTLVDSKGFSFG